jgi:hypothetical protein
MCSISRVDADVGKAVECIERCCPVLRYLQISGEGRSLEYPLLVEFTYVAE